MAAREFLGERGVDFRSLNIRDEGEGTERWQEAGRPTVPSLVVDGEAHPVLHVSQLAELLDLDPPAGGSPVRDAHDAAAILDLWLGRIRALGWERLRAPTASRGRSLRGLTVNVFHPFELLPGAWDTGRFDWRPEDDGLREAELGDRQALVGWAAAIALLWGGFEFDGDRGVETSRGDVSWSSLLSFQRWHAAYHYRQLAVSLGEEPDLDLEDLSLPAEVF